jgi:5-methylcytosine-specific restriction protein A
MSDPFYSSKAWHKLRAQALKRDGYRCRMCGVDVRAKGAASVDHIVPRKLSPGLALDLSNLQVLCKYHHDSTKQLIEKRIDVEPIGLDGLPDSWR